MLYISLWLIFGLLAAVVYKNKGRNPVGAFIVGLLLGPIGVLLAMLSSTNPKGIEARQLANGASKKCPSCAEVIKIDAQVCKHCGHKFTPDAPRVAAAPTPAPAVSVEERLRQLDSLRTKGLITDAEYAQRRTALIESV